MSWIERIFHVTGNRSYWPFSKGIESKGLNGSLLHDPFFKFLIVQALVEAIFRTENGRPDGKHLITPCASFFKPFVFNSGFHEILLDSGKLERRINNLQEKLA